MAGAVRPVAGDRDHAVGGEVQLADPLLGGQHDALPPLAVTGLIHDQGATRMGSERRARLPERQPPSVELRGVPPSIVQEVVQPLALRSRYQGCQDGQRLVVLAGQQQPDQVLAERLACGASAEEVIELSTESVDGLDRRPSGLARRNHLTPPPEPDPFSLPRHLPRPEVTNQRLEAVWEGQEWANLRSIKRLIVA